MDAFKQSEKWDYHSPLINLVTWNTDCLLCASYVRHNDDFDAVSGGSIFFANTTGGYTQLSLGRTGWLYVSDCYPSRELLASLTPMKTVDAMRLIEASAISVMGV